MNRFHAILGKLVVVLTVVVIASTAFGAGPVACEIAQPFERPDDVPAAGDVTIRSLNFRPMDKNDKNDTMQSMQDFHATRLEWVYLRFNDEEKQLIEQVKDLGRVFGSAGQSATAVEVELSAGREYVAYCMIDINGEPLFLSHSRYWTVPIYPGCVNNPTYKKRNLEYYERNIDWGAEVIQRDDPAAQHHFAMTGQGCFCEFCMAGFRDYLKKHATPALLDDAGIEEMDDFCYRTWLHDKGLVEDNKAKSNPLSSLFAEFQKETLVQFFRDIRTAVNIHAKKHVPFSSNNTSYQRWEEPYYTIFDFGISELLIETANPAHIYERAQKACSLGKVQVFGSPKTRGQEYPKDYLTALKRKVIATTYAVGAMSRVPWDIFEQTKDGKGRYFGKPHDYADLYGFVRANDKYLAGYQDAGAFGPDIEETRYGSIRPVKVNGEKVYAFVRAVPGDRNAPVVIHLVDWNEKPQGKDIEIVLQDECFFADKQLTCAMYVPAAYNKAEHDRAEKKALAMLRPGEKLSSKQAAAFERMSEPVQPRIRHENGKTILSAPALNPWAMLVVSGR